MTIESIPGGAPRTDPVHGHFADPPPPAAPVHFGATPWLRVGSMLIGVVAALWIARRELHAAHDARFWALLSTDLTRLPMWENLVAALILLISLFASVGLREQPFRRGAWLPSLSLLALSLILLALLHVLSRFLG